MEIHFEALALGQRQLTKVSNKLEQALAEFISQLPPIKQEPADGAVENPHVPTPASASIADKPQKMKPSLLTEFDGDCAKGHTFMNLCHLYIGLCPGEFPDDEKKIFWVLSFFKKDRAATWVDCTLRWAEHHGCPHHAMWDAFIKDYISHFCPPNERTTVLNSRRNNITKINVTSRNISMNLRNSLTCRSTRTASLLSSNFAMD
jgi:hypothetical protein